MEEQILTAIWVITYEKYYDMGTTSEILTKQVEGTVDDFYKVLRELEANIHLSVYSITVIHNY